MRIFTPRASFAGGLELDVPRLAAGVGDEVMADDLPALARGGAHEVDVERRALVRGRAVRPVLAPDGVLVRRVEQLEVVHALGVEVARVDRAVAEVRQHGERAAVGFLEELALRGHEVAERARAEALREIVERRELVALRRR